MKTFAVASLLAVAAIAPATVLDFRADLNGAQEVPSVTSPVTATIFLKVDSTTRQILSGTGKLSEAFATSITGFHIHRGAAGTNGSVVVNIGTGAFNGLNIAFSGQSMSQAIFDEMIAGNTYFNIHTTEVGTGEIRGQIQAVPEPGTMIALGAGIAALAARRRARRG